MAAFTHLYMPLMHRQGFVAPNLGGKSPQASPGGFVMDSQPGLYESVLVLDYKSLYPSIIRTFLIDPVGLIEGLQHPDDSDSVPGFRGARFSRTRHCLPAIVARVAEGRETAKREHNAPLSQALKIIMNAFYGVLGSSGCRFFDPRDDGRQAMPGSGKACPAKTRYRVAVIGMLQTFDQPDRVDQEGADDRGIKAFVVEYQYRLVQARLRVHDKPAGAGLR